MLVKRTKAGFGHVLNLGIGLAGALIGGFLFKVLHIDLGLVGAVTITSEQVVAGFVGSLVFLAVIWVIGKFWERRSQTRDHKLGGAHPR
jgi:uncharacterized membrane protein YeaQ/YmgE (transglycosylase-associated protein family)